MKKKRKEKKITRGTLVIYVIYTYLSVINHVL